MRHARLLLIGLALAILLLPSKALGSRQWPDEDSLVVRVIRDPDGQRLDTKKNGIVVQRVERQSLPADFETDLLSCLTRALASAEASSSDHEGLFVLPRPKEPELIVVWTAEYFGYAEVDPRHRDIRLEVATHQLVHVDVVDAEGRAVAAIPVEFRCLMEPRVSPLAPRSVGVVLTGGDGRASFLCPPRWRFWRNLSELGQVRAQINLAHTRSQVVRLEENEDGSLRGRHVLPPHGRLEIRLHSEQGLKPPVGKLHVSPIVEAPSGNFREPGLTDVELGTGPHTDVMEVLVELGQTFYLRLCDRNVMGFITRKIEGPTQVGETLVYDFELPAGTGQFRLRGRLKRVDGEPLNRRPFSVDLNSVQRPWFHESELEGALTDEEGYFDVALDLARDDRSDPIEVQISSGPHQAYFVGPVFQIDPQGQETIDIGDVTMTSEARVVRGRVVDERGRGLADTELLVSILGSDAILIGHATPIGRSFKTDDDGSFEFRSDQIRGSFNLEVVKDGYLPQSRELEVGATDVEIRLKAFTGIQGRIALAGTEPFVKEEVGISVEGPQGSVALEGASPFEGRFAAEVEPGACRVRFFLREAPHIELLPALDLEIPDHEVLDIGTIKLEVPQGLCRIDVQRSAAHLSSSGPCRLRLYALGATEPFRVESATLRSGMIYFFHEGPPIEVEVVRGGEVLPRVTLHHSRAFIYDPVQGPPGTIVRLRLEGLEDLNEDLVLGCDFGDSPRLERLGPDSGPEIVHPENPSLWCRAVLEGDHEITLLVGVRSAQGIDWEPTSPLSFRFEDLPKKSRPEASIRIDPATIYEALGRMRERRN